MLLSKLIKRYKYKSYINTKNDIYFLYIFNYFIKSNYPIYIFTKN